jgi:phosphonate transport system substrate-binding protein
MSRTGLGRRFDRTVGATPAVMGAGARWLLAACLAWLVLLAGAVSASDRDRPLLLGVHPFLAPAELRLRFDPLAAYLGDALGQPVVVRVGRDYEEHIEEIGHDRLDIAYLGPASYIRLTRQFGDRPVLARLERSGRALLTGRIVVRDDSAITRLADLRGKRFAFGDPASTMSSIVPQAFLAEAGIGLGDLAQFRHYQGHDNVALAVLSGQADAGALKDEVYQQFEPRGLRAIAALPPVSEHLFVTRSDMPPARVARLRGLLLAIDQDPRGQRALRALHRAATGLRTVSDADYDNLRAMLAASHDDARTLAK